MADDKDTKTTGSKTSATGAPSSAGAAPPSGEDRLAALEAKLAEQTALNQELTTRLREKRAAGPADDGATLHLDQPFRRRSARALPTDGVVELELVHGSYHDGGEYKDVPARPGTVEKPTVLAFNMALPDEAATAKRLLAYGVCDRI